MALVCAPKLQGIWSHQESKIPAIQADFCYTSGWTNGALQASTAATDQYCTTYDTSTTDSAASEQEVLACHELLLVTDDAPTDGDAPSVKTSRNESVPLFSFTTPDQHDVRETIRNELVRERDTQPRVYLRCHAYLSKELRAVAVSWAIQVVEQFRVEQETLFLAVSYLDRFLSVTEDVVHMDGLHLATLACLSLAAKQAEVTQPSTAEWTWLVHSNPWGTKEQLSRMEWIIMDNLEWRGCTPTSWWFLHQFCFGLGTCPAPAICMAAYLLELALLDASCLAYRYSSLAAAALMLGHTMSIGAAESVAVNCLFGSVSATPLAISSLLELAPELSPQQVRDACVVLADLHARASALPAPNGGQALEGLQLVQCKYASEVWHRVGDASTSVNLKVALTNL